MNTHLMNISGLSLSGGTAKARGTDHPGLFARLVAWVADMPRRNREAAELASFNDRELADIGLSRSDLDRVQTPEFAAEYNKGRNIAMFLMRA